MLGKKLNRLTVRYRICLRQVSHGFDQLPLPVNVARIRRSLTSLTSYLRSDRDCENLGHKRVLLRSESFCPLLFSLVASFWQYTVLLSVFQPLSFHRRNALVGQPYTSSDYCPDPLTNNGLPLRRYKFGFARGLQLKYGIRNPLIQLNIGVLSHAVIA
jgi:hypothetical protein